MPRSPGARRWLWPLDVMDDLRSEMDALFNAMLPQAMSSRFCGLLAMKPERWAKIDPWKVWEKPPFGQPQVSEWRGSRDELLASPTLRQYANGSAVVLRCGHSSPPSLQREALRAVLDESSHVDDGFVSITTGKLGLAINHDGGLCVLRKP